MPNSLLTNYLCPHLSKPAWGWEACRDCFSLPPPLWPMHPSCSSCCPWLFRGKRWWAREASQLDRCRCDLAQVSLVLRTQVLPLFCKGALPRSSEHLTLGTFHSSFQIVASLGWLLRTFYLPRTIFFFWGHPPSPLLTSVAPWIEFFKLVHG